MKLPVGEDFWVPAPWAVSGDDDDPRAWWVQVLGPLAGVLACGAFLLAIASLIRLVAGA